MNLSPEVQLVWSIAGQEAIHAHRENIQPEHFMCAFLKYAELTDEELRRMSVEEDVAEDLISVREDISKVFEDRQWPTRRIRHRLRKIMGQGDHEHEGGVVHRSPETKELFNRAIRKASHTLTSTAILEELLESPTPNIQQALEDVGAAYAEKESSSVVDNGGEEKPSPLSQYTERMYEDETSPTILDSPQIMVLSEALDRIRQEPLLIVCETGVSFKTILRNAAHMNGIASSFRCINMDTIYSNKGEMEAQKRMMSVFEAAVETENLLVVDFVTQPPEDLKEKVGDLEFSIGDQVETMPLIVAVKEDSYHELFSGNDSLSGEFRIIWFHEIEDQKVPTKI